MRRQLRLQLRAGKALYDEACRQAGIAFRERRFQDAIDIYEQFAQEHPQVQTEELQTRLNALKEYLKEHVEKLPGSEVS
jgi:histidinol dehydrogenase